MSTSSVSFPYVVEKIERGIVFRPKIPVTLNHNEKSLEDGVILGRDTVFREFDITFEENARRIVLQKVGR